MCPILFSLPLSPILFIPEISRWKGRPSSLLPSWLSSFLPHWPRLQRNIILFSTTRSSPVRAVAFGRIRFTLRYFSSDELFFHLPVTVYMAWAHEEFLKFAMAVDQQVRRAREREAKEFFLKTFSCLFPFSRSCKPALIPLPPSPRVSA